MNAQKTYHFSVDGVRVVAILAVLIIHTTTRTLEASHSAILQFPLTFFLNQVARFAVPLFFLISGFVLEVNYEFHQSYFSYLKKRLSKIFIPYLFWSAVYYLFVYTNHSVEFVTALLGGNASYQLYFIPTLLIFYLLFPLLHKIYFVLSHKIVFTILVIIELFLIASDYYFHPLHIFYPVDIAILNFIYFLAGMIASHHIKRIHRFAIKNIFIISILTMLSAIVTAYEGAHLYLVTDNYLDYYSSWRPIILIYTVFLSILLWIVFEKLTFLHKPLHVLSRLSFLVFFIHVVVLEIMWSLLFHTLFINTQYNFIEKMCVDIFYYVSVVVVSYAGAYIVHKLPYISKITG